MSTAAKSKPLKAPFPYPGGKARVADEVWRRLGDCKNFIEPFAGSLAVLLRRPAEHFADGYRVETVGDVNHYLLNFWRSVQHAPDAVAEWADWPVLEGDLHARHRWLVRSREANEFRARMVADPEYHDPKFAGWWVWGQCCWIGGAWCHDSFVGRAAMPQLDHARGITKIPELAHGAGRGSPQHHGRPQLADAFDIGRGVNGGGNRNDRPRLADCRGPSGVGITGNWASDTCEARRAWLTDWMRRLADRLRLVRTCYGHWSRICDSDSTLTRLGTTGVFLDPPYPARRGDTGEHSRDGNLYATDKLQDLDALRDEVLAWCRKWGGAPRIRVAVCGYEGDGYEALTTEGWTEHAWVTAGGYANQRRAGKGKSANAGRERIYFSPGCIRPKVEPNLFAAAEALA